MVNVELSGCKPLARRLNVGLGVLHSDTHDFDSPAIRKCSSLINGSRRTSARREQLCVNLIHFRKISKIGECYVDECDVFECKICCSNS